MNSMRGIARFIWACLVVGVLENASGTNVCAAEPDQAEDTWQFHGRVVDEHGHPVDDFVGATFWSSNGRKWDDNGKSIEIKSQRELNKLWKEEGVLAPYPGRLVGKLADGEFVARVEDYPRESVFIVDQQQRLGGYASVEKSDREKPVTVILLPLVRVTGKIYCPQAQRIPDWTAAIVHPVGDTGNYLHFTNCGSLKGEFSFLLPPGKYDLDVYSESPDARMPRPDEREYHDAPVDMPADFGGIRLEVPRDTPTLDLGVLNVVIPKGRGDYSSYYGKEPPALEITDVREISKDIKLADFRGKWVLLDFWSFQCGPCLHRSLPELTEFYEKHALDRSRFEILSICMTKDAKITTREEFEAMERPIVGSAWYGKQLPFPVLIDGQGKTCDAYGVGRFPFTLLIDPEGHLVKWGDHTMLEEKLNEKP